MLKEIIIVVAILLLVGINGVAFYKEFDFGIDVEGHMERAAHANTVPLAIQEMEVVA